MIVWAAKSPRQRDRGEEDLRRRLNLEQARAHSLGEGRVPGVERQEYPHLMPSSEVPALRGQLITDGANSTSTLGGLVYALPHLLPGSKKRGSASAEPRPVFQFGGYGRSEQAWS